MTKFLTYLGASMMVFAFIIFILEKISGAGISTWLATKMCGDTYMQEPDPLLAQQQILTENACGFDADMNLIIFVVGLFTMGMVLLWAGLRNRTCASIENQ